MLKALIEKVHNLQDQMAGFNTQLKTLSKIQSAKSRSPITVIRDALKVLISRLNTADERSSELEYGSGEITRMTTQRDNRVKGTEQRIQNTAKTMKWPDTCVIGILEKEPWKIKF